MTTFTFIYFNKEKDNKMAALDYRLFVTGEKLKRRKEKLSRFYELDAPTFMIEEEKRLIRKAERELEYIKMDMLAEKLL